MDPYTLRLRGRLWFFGHTHGQTLRQFVGHLQQLGHFRCRRSEEHTSELQSLRHLVCRLLLEKKKKKKKKYKITLTNNKIYQQISKEDKQSITKKHKIIVRLRKQQDKHNSTRNQIEYHEPHT